MYRSIFFSARINTSAQCKDAGTDFEKRQEPFYLEAESEGRSNESQMGEGEVPPIVGLVFVGVMVLFARVGSARRI